MFVVKASSSAIISTPREKSKLLGKNGMGEKTHLPILLGSRVKGSGILVRAAISGGEKPVVKVNEDRSDHLVSASSLGVMEVKAEVRIRKKKKDKLMEKLEDQLELFVHGIGQGFQILLISEEVDPVTDSGKSAQPSITGWLPRPLNDHPNVVGYTANFTVPNDFGCPGALLITNLHGKEFHLLEIVLHGFEEGPIFFHANTWIHSRKDNPESRIIFKNQAHLPSKTPTGIKYLRKEDLRSIRGHGKGERKTHDRVYDYDLYNDLGDPDNEDLTRQVLGGEKKPFPRRCRTGRPPTKSDPKLETRVEKPRSLYVPRDETFEEIKEETFAAGRLKALLHNLVPSLAASLSSSDIPFNCFGDIDKLYNDGVVLNLKDGDNNQQNNEITNKFPLVGNFIKQVVSVSERLLKFDTPAVIKRDRFSWLRDNEFARQCLAGVNPVNIEIVKEFPILSKLDPEIYGPPESAITKELIEHELNGISVEKAIEENRLFMLDFHDLLFPLIEKINSLPDRKAYASRTVFFYTETGVLRPLAIELSLPTNKRVYTHGHDATTHWIWNLAKAHVCSNESAVHQLVNHWVRTHASMEPYIIATHRQLSSMHPIYKLLHPHMRYTLEINALARQSLVNGGGVLETCFTPGKYAMDVSSAAYKTFWRFDMEALPADLLRRGMAVEDPSKPCGVRLVIEDYPYAADGLLVWSAIKEWVESYVEHFYSELNSVKTDVELQAWWDEIKNKGHYDKRNETWWPKLNTKQDLSGILTTIIWVASGQHAAINFGQYPYGGYVPNRPNLMRKLIPQATDSEYEKFMLNPEKAFLSSLPTQLQVTKIMAVLDSLSTHSPDEEYLGQVNHFHAQNWTSDEEILKLFNKFSARLEEIEEIINKRNKDIGLKNRSGAGVPPYEVLLPWSGPGVTGRGIPNSISI